MAITREWFDTVDPPGADTAHLDEAQITLALGGANLRSTGRPTHR